MEAEKDLIERQAAIDALDRFSLGETDAVKLAFRMGDYLKRLPSAQPERKTGRWINSSNMEKAVVCSECGEEAWYRSYCGYVTKSKFCPNCGAKMEVGHDISG